MKFFLTVYICSFVANQCMVAPGYPKPKIDYYHCMKDGLGESYEVLFGGEFSEDDIVVARLYPKWACDKVIVPPKKPVPKNSL